MHIVIDSYDSNQYTSLSATEMGERYLEAVSAQYPDASVRLVADGKGVRVWGYDYKEEDLVLEDVRNIINSVWASATINHPWERLDTGE